MTLPATLPLDQVSPPHLRHSAEWSRSVLLFVSTVRSALLGDPEVRGATGDFFADPHSVQTLRTARNLPVGGRSQGKVFSLSNSDGLKSHKVDYGDYMPKELQLFAESFRKSVAEWELIAETDVVVIAIRELGAGLSARHQATGAVVRLEVLGFWRRTDVEKLYKRLAAERTPSFWPHPNSSTSTRPWPKNGVNMFIGSSGRRCPQRSSSSQ